MFPVRSRERTVRNHFKHSVELVDREGEIADVLAAVEDFLLARATYEAARQRWPKERIRLRQETRIVEDGSEPHGAARRRGVHGRRHCRGGDPADYPVGVCVLENDAPVPVARLLLLVVS
jgi:hypothetical protein